MVISLCNNHDKESITNSLIEVLLILEVNSLYFHITSSISLQHSYIITIAKSL